MKLRDFLDEVASEYDLDGKRVFPTDYELEIEFPFLDRTWPPTEKTTKRKIQSIEVDDGNKTIRVKVVTY